MHESRLVELFPILDHAVFERQADGSFRLATVAPAWLVELIGRRREGIALLEAFPFLEAFLGEADAFWWTEQEGLVWSSPFVAGGATGEHHLRAAAATVWTSQVLVLQRLTGDADTRPVLQAAREGQLEQERLRGRVDALRKPVSTIASAANQLLEGDLRPEQREIAERIARAAERITTLI